MKIKTGTRWTVSWVGSTGDTVISLDNQERTTTASNKTIRSTPKMSQKVVINHRVATTANSQPGQETTFIVYFPASYCSRYG